MNDPIIPLGRVLVPQGVTRRQGKAALIKSGKMATVQAAFDAIADPVVRDLAWNWFNESDTFDRQHPMMLQLAALCNFTDADLDALFQLADTL